MGRWRPPIEQGSPYITAAGYAALEAELELTWKRRRDVVKHLAAAAAEGDRSENAEYIYRKKELAGIDRRIRDLQRRMPKLKIVADVPTDTTQIFFGASVELEDEQGNSACYRIVGPDEIDGAKGWISIDSPMAKALMKRTIDDEVLVSAGERERCYVVIGVTYAAGDGSQDSS
tara:strand:- start:924 stop:1445 length:522 start_codon:yes stop_codon:yes gene_type:complete